ncbi:MAG TPA: hypothetical protein VNP95_04985 [Thermomicrobiales bacterium]|nr:hypothetical protein [Thermomicrobiales bacterium]
MKYEVRYLVNGDEQTAVIDAETAASAAQAAQDELTAEAGEGQFELIQVQLIDEVEEYTTPANDDAFDPQ